MYEMPRYRLQLQMIEERNGFVRRERGRMIQILIPARPKADKLHQLRGHHNDGLLGFKDDLVGGAGRRRRGHRITGRINTLRKELATAKIDERQELAENIRQLQQEQKKTAWGSSRHQG